MNAPGSGGSRISILGPPDKENVIATAHRAMSNRTGITALPLLQELSALLPDHPKVMVKATKSVAIQHHEHTVPLAPAAVMPIIQETRFFSRNESGVTRKEVFLLVLVLSFLALMFLPPAHGPYRSSRLGCINNLKQIGLGFHIWASDNDSRFPMQVSVTNGGTMELSERGDVFPHFLVMSNELNTPKVLFCPADAQRQAAVTFSDGLANANISYFVGLDAQESLPQMWLAGDDCFSINGNPPPSGILSLPANAAVSWNQSRHRRLGNVALVDGSVLRISDTRELQHPFAQIPLATNRLVIP
ncbi:MAG TPA: hypothetical protein PLT00_14560 [Verrucomicrobiota bacterium]|jgi:hypothetical protein|nr:hypothetical protein [Verrucomicrobiota bacterium]HQB17922.1 hypothetical protein [Verrucomicrobiota bacterium]